MPDTRLSIRVDENVKKQAEEIFNSMGLTLSAGVNLYLYRVAAEKGIPFLLTHVSNDNVAETNPKKQPSKTKAQSNVESIMYQRR